MHFEHLPSVVNLLISVPDLLTPIVAYIAVLLSNARLGMRMHVATWVIAFPTSASASQDVVVQTRLDAELRCLLGVYDLPLQKTVNLNFPRIDGQLSVV